jgi:hypothetical protein
MYRCSKCEDTGLVTSWEMEGSGRDQFCDCDLGWEAEREAAKAEASLRALERVEAPF